MKHNVFGWAAAVAVSLAGVGAASAADMAVKARPVPVALFSWTGCYIGISGGGKWARAQENVVIPAAGLFGQTAIGYTTEPDTWLVGGQAGCNMQSGNWVFGVEADAHAQRWSSLYTLGAGFPAPFVIGDQYGLSSDWQASVRGRVGYAMDRTLFYVTGGVAFTEIKSYTNWIPFQGAVLFPGTIAYDRQIAFGGTIGAGIEYAWTNNFTVGVEGRYTWYGTERLAAGPLATTAIIGAAPAFIFSNTYRDVRLETAEVLVKANWKFGGPAAVVAKY
jgi:outer membrane immunogenic protein